MNIREKLNARPAVTAVITIAVIVAAAVLIYLHSGFNNKLPIPQRAFFTTDGGTTYFVDDINKIPPFDHEGKTAYRCYVFTCDSGATTFVARLERYTAPGKAQAEDMLKKGASLGMPMQRFGSLMTETRAPGPNDATWVPTADPRAAALMTPRGPDGNTNNVKAVYP